MQAGPRATFGFDLALTELLGDRHRFVVEVGSERGREMLSRVAVEDAQAPELVWGSDAAAACLRWMACRNPFKSPLVRLVEIAQSFEEAIGSRLRSASSRSQSHAPSASATV